MKALVCIDDDPLYEDVLGALEWCLSMGEEDEAIVTHVVAPLRWMPSRSEDGPGWAGRERDILEKVDDFLALTVRRLDERGIRASRLRLEGDAASEIASAARERAAHVVVLGALGQARSRDFLVGSVAEKVSSLVETDVLLVRPRTGGGASFRALLAVDASGASERAVASFAARAGAESATIRVVHVLESPPAGWGVEHDADDAVPPALRDRADAALGRSREILREHGLEADTEIRRGSAAGEIVEAARGFEADLIVLASHGENRPRALSAWQGSVAKRVVRHAPCSVLVHHPPLGREAIGS